MFKWIAGGVATFFASRYLFRLNKASNTVVTNTRLEVKKVTLSGIELKANVHLQNPTNLNLTLQYPFINLTHRGGFIGSSVTRNEIITLTKNSEQSFEMIIRSAGWFTLIQSLGASIVKQIRSGQETLLELLVTTTTQVNGLPFKKEESLKLKI